MTQFEIPTIVIEPEFLEEAAEAGSFLLKVPEHAKVTGKGNKLWTELFDINAASMGVVENNTDRVEIIVQFKVAADSADDTNVGSNFRARYLVNPKAMASREKTKERTMSLMSVNRLGNLLRAVGQLDSDTSATQVRLNDFFAGDEPPVVGQKVYALLKAYKDKEGVSRQDILQFDDLSAGAPTDG